MSIPGSSSTSSMITTFDPSTSKYTVKFGGRTIVATVTDKAAIADDWASEMLFKYAGIHTSESVGLGIGCKPTSNNKSATLHLCIDDECLIVQLLYLDLIPKTLKAFLAAPNFLFAGVGVAENVRKIKDEYGLECKRSSDIRDCADGLGFLPRPASSVGLRDLASTLCGLSVPIPKHVCVSNWDARVLTVSQVEYACINAYASCMVSQELELGVMNR